MDIFTYYESEIKRLSGILEQIKALLLQNKEFSLEERWNMFLRVEKYLPIETYYNHAISELFSGDLYDTLCNDRHQTLRYTSLVERLEEDEGWVDEDHETILKQYDLTIEQVKETILATGYAGFIYDW